MYQGRHEWDFDVLYQNGLGKRPDAGRYDLSWQYRLTPTHYPEWGINSQLNSVIELNGRWREDSQPLHQLTLGLQWVHSQWVLEGGIAQDLNGPQDTHVLFSARFHF